MRFLPIFFLVFSGLQAQKYAKTILKLPDTDQTKSYTNTFGEDNDYQINKPAYSKVGNFCVFDSVTGLMWQAKDGGEMTFEMAKLFCDTSTLGGYADWRMPTSLELYSLVNLQNNNPALNKNYFTSIAEYWWSSQTQSNDTNRIWVVNSGGGIGNHLKSETISAGGTKKFHVFAVRQVLEPTVLVKRFVSQNSVVFLDSVTSLIWQIQSNYPKMDWENALGYAENLSSGGYTDWRLPNIKELQSLSDYTLIGPAFPTAIANLGIKNYWSGTSLGNQQTKAWYWNTQYGITTYANKTDSNYVICVRGGLGSQSKVNTVVNENYRIYPNPFFDKINISGIGQEIVELYDSNYKLLFRGIGLEKQNFSNLKPGVYCVVAKGTAFKLIK